VISRPSMRVSSAVAFVSACCCRSTSGSISARSAGREGLRSPGHRHQHPHRHWQA
jgi:hypothetical protein